jgi:hypothetical protein
LYDEPTALHESGHSVAASVLGCKVRLVSVEPGQRWGGICHYAPPLVRDKLPQVATPLVTCSGHWQQRLAADAVFAMAGGLAEELFAPRGTASVRLPESVSDQACERLEVLAADEPAAATVRVPDFAWMPRLPGKRRGIAFPGHGRFPARKPR